MRRGDECVAAAGGGVYSGAMPEAATATSGLWHYGGVGAAAMTAVAACLILHYEVLKHMARRGLRSHTDAIAPKLARGYILRAVMVLLITHAVQITLFGVALFTLTRVMGPGVGSLRGEFDDQWPDYVYFSAAVFTTVGFGDIVPIGPLRFFVAIEALTGLVLITWSASLAFLLMERHWAGPRPPVKP